MMQTRDAGMADNVLAILRANPSAKFVLWAHNGHVAKTSPTNSSPSFVTMGHLLNDALGGRTVSVGFIMGVGKTDRRRGVTIDIPFPPADAIEAGLMSRREALVSRNLFCSD